MARTGYCGISDSLVRQPAVCPHCGVAATVDGGGCLQCLLHAGLEGGNEESDDFDEQLTQIEVSDQDWQLGNYQILEEIGRGGMGVIYRARQRHSRRVVALKRVLSYHGDSRETLERFRREAEAAASLDHPNILPILEVGEADGLPFFTMKYAIGGSLQQAAAILNGDPHECVRLLAKVARAIASAHAGGILHRDLKPGNILLDARGEPMVTDFGLAKWIDTDSDLTRSLAIFGTPGFIAPEQATGDRASLTAAADVYSLGAILFHLLAGRPPFLGEHALAVIRQAAENDAPKLRAVTGRADRDLETICAKCLEREPHARYRSASALADDLECWLEGRAIAARPITLPEKTWRRARRNPRFAGSIAICLILAAVGFAGWISRSHLSAALQNAESARHSYTIAPLVALDEVGGNPEIAWQFTDSVQSALSNYSDLHLQPFAHISGRHADLPRAEDWKRIGQFSKARLIISGSVRQRFGKHRVAVHLIDSATGAVIDSSLFDVQNAEEFRELIRPWVAHTAEQANRTQTSQAPAGGTENREALGYYEHAKEFYFRFNIPDLDRAIISAQRAVELDPNYADAYALTANGAALLAILRPDSDWLRTAESAARNALEISPSLPEAHRASAKILNVCGDLALSLDSYLTAYELQPGDARTAAMVAGSYGVNGRPDLEAWWVELAMDGEARPIYSDILGDALASLGDLDAAAIAYRTGGIFRADLPSASIGLSRIALMRGDVATARAECAKVRARFPTNPQPILMAAFIEFAARNFSAAEPLYREVLRMRQRGGCENRFAPIECGSALAYIKKMAATEGGNEELAAALDSDNAHLETAPGNPFFRYSAAANQAALGYDAAALETLAAAIDAGWVDSFWLKSDPRLDSLREHAEFKELVGRLELRIREMARRRREQQAISQK